MKLQIGVENSMKSALEYGRIVVLTSEAILARKRTISKGTKKPIPDIPICFYHGYQAKTLMINHSVLSDGQTANVERHLSNQFIDFILLLDIRTPLCFEKEHATMTNLQTKPRIIPFLFTDFSSIKYASMQQKMCTRKKA